MTFYYKTINGNTGMVKEVDALPSNVDKLIIRRYNGDEIRIPHTNELILDCNRSEIHNISFKCDRLSIYRPNIEWFNINDVWAGYDAESNSTFNTLNRLKLEHVRNTSGMFSNTLCSNIPIILDFSNIKNRQKLLTHRVALMFNNTQLTTIPGMIDPPKLSYMTIFHGTNIHKYKLKAADVLLKISKKGESS